MARKLLIAVLALGAIAMVSCTKVQKRSATGGGAGAATGAAIGHYASSLGGGPGALIGLGLGAAAGALTGEHPDGSEGAATIAAAEEEARQLSQELQARDAELRGLNVALEKEQAQQKALLEAYEQSRQGRVTLQTSVPVDVQVASDSKSVTFTILSEVLFRSGQVELTKEGKGALRQAARVIQQQFPDATIQVRGHTDNVPIRYSPYKSNWELSCARALAVVHFLIESEGFDPPQLAAVGCADTRPVASNEAADGRRKNRRAELVVVPKDVQVAEVRASR